MKPPPLDGRLPAAAGPVTGDEEERRLRLIRAAAAHPVPALMEGELAEAGMPGFRYCKPCGVTQDGGTACWCCGQEVTA